MQCADVKKVLESVHKVNMGGDVVVLDGDRRYMQNKEANKKTRTTIRANMSWTFGCR